MQPRILCDTQLTGKQMPEITLINVATFDNPTIAHIARSRLESEGILAVLDGEHHVAMDWMITNAVGGVKLLVRSTDSDSAIRILTETPEVFQHDQASDCPRDDGDICCPDCESPETYRERMKRKWIYLSILFLGIPIPFLSNKMICESCGNKWTFQKHGKPS